MVVSCTQCESYVWCTVTYCEVMWGHVMCESYVWCTVTYCETMWGHVTRVTSWKHVVCMTVGVEILAPANFWYRRTGNFWNQKYLWMHCCHERWPHGWHTSTRTVLFHNWYFCSMSLTANIAKIKNFTSYSKETLSHIAVYVVIAVCFDLLPSFPLPRRPCRGGVRRHSHPPVRGYRQNNWEPPAHGGNILW